MKRHPSLHPLSRDHHEGLMLCRTIHEALQKGEREKTAAFEMFRREWGGWLPNHFEEEERWIPRLTRKPELLRRLHEEHRAISELAGRLRAPDAGTLGEFAILLHDHIRWEERVLFPAIEQGASEPILRELGDAMRAMESTRPRSCNL